MKKILLLALLVIILPISAIGKTFPPGFDLQSHRGGRGVYPENTMSAFIYSAELGVTTLELDLQLTKDGIPIISHNPILEPYLAKYNGKWVVKGKEPVIGNLSLIQLKKYTVGETDPDSEYYKERCPGQNIVSDAKIPSLEELFQEMNEHNFKHIRFNIELKSYPDGPGKGMNGDPETFIKAVMNIIKKYNMQDRVTIQSFDWRILTECRRLYKDEVLLSALTVEQPDELCRQVNVPGASPWMGGLDIDDFDGNYMKAVKAINADIVSPYYKELDEAMIKEAHSLGLKVIPWTVNAKEDMEKLIDWGVDGIITDRPDILKEVVVERKINI